MPSFEIRSDDSDNPYRALVAAGSSYAAGAIRVQPPFIPSKGWLEFVGTEARIELRDWVSGSTATTLWYEARESDDDKEDDQYEERIRRTTSEIIAELGNLASEKLFLKNNT